MNKTDIVRFFKSAQKAITKHSPEILTGLGIAGMITSTVLAVKATPKALKMIDEKKEELQVEKLPPVETVKAAWKPYIPAAVTGVASVSCLIGASSVSLRRNAALATAYKLSETALAEYQDAVVKTIGEKKERAVKEQVSKTRVEQNPPNNNEIYVTTKGETRILDPISKRYFKSDMEHVKRVENMLNKRMIHDVFGYVSLSEFYDEVGLERTDISDDMGWNINSGMIDIDYHPILDNEGNPCIALYFLNAPKWGYDENR